MGTIASQENPDSGLPSEEGARSAILDAARKLAERDGVLEMTLTGVAREAGVAATAIYTFFTSKNDLLQAVVADDMARLARIMRRSLVSPDSTQPTEIEGSSMAATQSRNSGGDTHSVRCQPCSHPYFLDGLSLKSKVTSLIWSGCSFSQLRA